MNETARCRFEAAARDEISLLQPRGAAAPRGRRLGSIGRGLAAALALLIAGAAAAQEERPMTPEEFRAFAEGRTLWFRAAGTPPGRYYGAEQYLSGDRVIWMFSDGTCDEGVWRAQGDELCFRYDSAPEVEQCWFFFDRGGAGVARPRSGGQEIFVVRESRRPLACPGPDVGA